MPIPAPEQVIRGIFVQLVRAKKVPNQFEARKLLNAQFPGVYNPVQGAELKSIENELKGGPFSKVGMVEFSFQYWFNYFFKEVPSERKIEFAAYVVNDDGSFRTEASNPGKPWKAIFKEM